MCCSRGCVGSQIRLVACLSIGKHLTQVSSVEGGSESVPGFVIASTLPPNSQLS